MQDVQNIPNPDVDNIEYDEDGGIHPFTMPDTRDEQDSQNTGIESPDKDIPVPPDVSKKQPIEEPPEQQDLPPIEDDQNDKRQRLV